MRTPEAASMAVRSSPRSLRNNSSKRKLDLNVLIDQMPSSDFIEIGKGTHDEINSLMNKLDKSAEKSSHSKKNPFRQPLTEHQKEVRRKKSFIPIEVQSVCCVLEPTMDSQMSCTMEDTQDTQSHNPVVAKNLKFDQEKHDLDCIKSAMVDTQNELNNQMDAEKSISENDTTNVLPTPNVSTNAKTESSKDDDNDEDLLIANMNVNNILEVHTPSSSIEAEKKKAESVPSLLTNSPFSNGSSVINFKSKIKPNKKIELFEVKRDDTNKSQETGIVENMVISVDTVEKHEPVMEEPVLEPSVEPSTVEKKADVLMKYVEKADECEVKSTLNRRRSTRLSVKAKDTQIETLEKPETKADASLVDEVEMIIENSNNSQKKMEESMSECGIQLDQIENKSCEFKDINADEILDRLNEECKINKINLKALRLKRRQQGLSFKKKNKVNDLMGIDHRHCKTQLLIF